MMDVVVDIVVMRGWRSSSVVVGVFEADESINQSKKEAM